MEIAILSITSGGRNLAEQLAAGLPHGAFAVRHKGGIGEALASLWGKVDGFICLMAAGIVVRSVAPLLEDKGYDPCVIVLDEKGKYIVSLLSGHLGGGNELAARVAALTGGEPVITTASDTLGLSALDLWAREQNLTVEDRKALTGLSAKLVNIGEIAIYTEVSVDSLPQGFCRVPDPGSADLAVSNRTDLPVKIAVFRPKNLVIGVGCNRGTPVWEFEEALVELFAEAGLSILGVRNLASIDLKKDEPGLLDFAAKQDWRLDFFDRNALNEVPGLVVSMAALQALGARGVAEPAALLSARGARRVEDDLIEQLPIRKRKWGNLTMAVARADFALSAPVRARQST